MDLEQPFAQRRVPPRVLGRGVGVLRNRDAELLRQHPHGVLEPDFFVELEELEHVAARLAAETVEEPLVRIDGEGRRLLRMERTETLVLGPRALQRHVLLDDPHDVRLQAKVIDELLREETHKELVSR